MGDALACLRPAAAHATSSPCRSTQSLAKFAPDEPAASQSAGAARTGHANPRFAFVPPQPVPVRPPAWVDDGPIALTRPVSRAAREARVAASAAECLSASSGHGHVSSPATSADRPGSSSGVGEFSFSATLSAPRPSTSAGARAAPPSASPHRSLAYPGSSAFTVSGVLGACACPDFPRPPCPPPSHALLLLLRAVADPATTLPRHPRLIRPVTADATRRAYVSEHAAQCKAEMASMPSMRRPHMRRSRRCCAQLRAPLARLKVRGRSIKYRGKAFNLDSLHLGTRESADVYSGFESTST